MVSFHLTSAILFGEILYAKVQRASGRQVSLSLTVPGYSSRQPSTNRRLTFTPHLVAGHSRTSLTVLLHWAVGYSVSSRTLFTCLIRPFPLSVLHKIIPRREAKRVSRKGKKKIFDNLKFTIMHSRIFKFQRSR